MLENYLIEDHFADCHFFETKKGPPRYSEIFKSPALEDWHVVTQDDGNPPSNDESEKQIPKGKGKLSIFDFRQNSQNKATT